MAQTGSLTSLEYRELTAEPNFLDFNFVPIFEKKTKWFSISNNSDSSFTADLIVCHEQWLRDFSPELVSISPVSVHLHPHEIVQVPEFHSQVSVTVRPVRANIQNFYIIYERESPERDKSEEPESREPRLSDVNSKHLVDITFIGDHVFLKANDIMLLSRHPIWDSQQCWSMFSMDMLNQLMIPYGHTADEGTLPDVSSVTFRFPPAPVDSEQSVFQILFSNTSDLKGYWELFTTPPKNWTTFVGRKKLNKLNSSLVYYDSHVKDNPDLLAKLWASKFEVGRGSEVPKDLPNSISNRGSGGNGKFGTLNSKGDMALFHISKTSGCINNKDSQVITFKYSFEKVGYHRISILLRIYPAIFIWIDLSGRTLDVDQPYLQPMYKHHLILHSVSPADLDPPVQMFWLYNGGNVTASFTVDTDPFETLKDKNFGHAVIDCLTRVGVVRPKSWFAIKLRFSPLEYTDYSVPLRLIPDYSETPVEVHVAGRAALNTIIYLRPKAPSLEIRTFAIYDHKVPVTLVPPHIAIPHLIPTGHKVSSAVFLSNLHTENHMFFRWPNVPIEGGGSITFQPDSGRIPPRGEMPCLVIVQAGKVSATFSTTIRCMIEDENEKVIYEFVLEQWNKEQGKAKLIDSTHRTGHRREKHPKPEPPQPFSRLLTVSVYIGSVFGLLDSIPPKERSRMGHAEPLGITRPFPNVVNKSPLTLSDFERQVSTEIISDVLWDIVQAPGFESFVRQATRRNAPLYEEYKECEMKREKDSDTRSSYDEVELARQSLEEVLEATVYNLIQEMSSNYMQPDTRDKCFDLPQVQPQAFVDVDKYKSYL